jgi:hypothetical protein
VICASFPGQLDAILLDRHIQLDEVHTPLASSVVRDLCADSAPALGRAETTAVRCMKARSGPLGRHRPCKKRTALRPISAHAVVNQTDPRRTDSF